MHRIHVSTIGAGKYRVDGAVTIVSTDVPIRAAAKALIDAGYESTDLLDARGLDVLITPMPLQRLMAPPPANSRRTPSPWGSGAPNGKLDARSTKFAAARWR